ncbi:twin-arginine translocase TatA/TatE family subunit [Streptomyces alkaliterrae]|uniref:Sec-independent protein translocase protein TatA n=1 Tax=Streptomyces alkaliterrae TaxID=2213162 RepID=A0A5P0YSA7_9ACTN|nr:twin-arginine translocase TatA/TatE family subunit [Streptomyces alkaliterrae]MBB1254781.1 twin-arginine translocase TatA/TatE family subunit [Streptomyces alkaliterrae]MBB1261187.1 twin-arginine translocase TatA/TatE family subunit [Streptomyces alkaliterrae]MQS03213.1 twin-arginine translocase TatA/TatE family subunit [Streptomyces alkaliterrae]
MVSNGIAPWHLLIVALVAVVVFGSKRLPDAARGLGRALRIFRAEVTAPTTATKPGDRSPAAD